MSQQFTKELEAMLNASEPVLILNCSLMTSIPNAVLKSRSCVKKLHELCLKNNSIVSLPSEISKLKALHKLYLPRNRLEHLPDVLTELPCLSHLDVSDNHITSITHNIYKMKALTNLNIGNNKITHLPDDFWRIPHLCTLNAHSNQIGAISSDIVHCQSLSKLILDCNDLQFLPTQITKLSSLRYLSLSGNKLQSLPNGFPAEVLHTMLVDSNPDLSCVPVSLAPLSWLGVLGIEKCSLHIKEEDLHFPKPLRTCSRVPSLTELTARSLHGFLKKSLQNSVMLWLPQQLCCLLQLPQGLERWLVPTGICIRCQQVYFQHHFAMLVSGMFYKKIDSQGRCKPDDLALYIDCCSVECAGKYLHNVSAFFNFFPYQV